MESIEISPGELPLQSIAAFCQSESIKVSVNDSAMESVRTSQATVQNVIEQNKTVYGINTGFGLLAQKRIALEELAQLQTNLVLSHAAGTGPLLADEAVRLILLLKLNSLARGYSGVRPIVLEYLIKFLNEGLMPSIPSKGSVGASGDLAPLAHMACALIGVGDVRLRGKTTSAINALQSIGLEPLELGPKEGLALLNGTQVSTALALIGLFRSMNVFSAALVAGAMSTDACLGSDTPFDPRIHEIRLHQGQIDCAKSYRELLAGSEIRQSHASEDTCDKVQDPYSIRCQPQVMGACLEHIRFVAKLLVKEANAVSDNPLVFSDQQQVLSGGNFHAEPVAMASDTLAIAIAEIGALSERRIALLIDQHLSGLPPFLVNEGGLNSGFMIAQVTAAALASENKTLAHPASVDSLPTSANQEDHVSMATFAARRLSEMADNTAGIVAIELLAAAQGIDFRAPLKTSLPLQQAHEHIRQLVPHYETDRLFQPDIEKITRTISESIFQQLAPIGWST